MRRIRLLLVGMPPMLHDIVQGILSAESDLEVVADMPFRDQLLPALEEERPDVLILGVEPSEAKRKYDDLLYAFPRLKVLDVTTDGRTAYLHELRPHAVSLGELSPGELLRAVRSVVPSSALGAN